MRIPLVLMHLVVGVFLMSGCVSQTYFAGGGLVVEEFSPDFPSIFPGEEVHLNLLLKNTGSVDAKVTDMQLTGLDVKSWRMKTNTCVELMRKTIKAGGSENCIIALVAPDTGDLEITYKPKIHVTYSYRTDAIALVTVGTLDEVRRISLQGKGLPYETESTDGPVAIDIKTASPVRVSGSSVEFPIRVTVTNGPGTVCSGRCGPDTWNKIKLSLGTALKLSDCPRQIELDLFKGQSNSFVCNLMASASDAGAGLTQKRVEVSSEYEYIVQKETSISIKKRTV